MAAAATGKERFACGWIARQIIEATAASVSISVATTVSVAIAAAISVRIIGVVVTVQILILFGALSQRIAEVGQEQVQIRATEGGA